MATVSQRLTVVEADVVKIKARLAADLVRLTQIEARLAEVEADILTTIRKIA